MTRVWMRSIIIIFISFTFGFVIGTIPVQKNVFPAYSQWVSNKKAAADSLQLSQSSRSSGSDEALALPEPGTLEEQQLVEKFTLYPLHFLEKTIESKRKLIEDTQVRSFFTFSRDDVNGGSTDSKKWVDKVHHSSFDARVFKMKGSIQAGPNHVPVTLFFSFKMNEGKYCWNLTGVFDLAEKKQRIDREVCSNLSDLGKFQDAPYVIFALHEKGVRDWLTYLAVPVPVLQEQPAKMLSLESETGLWKEDTLVDWNVVDPSEKARFEANGVVL
jgi:hypothetical protein